MIIHRLMPFNAQLFNSFPVPIYVPKNEVPKEFRVNAYGYLAESRIYADEMMFYSFPYFH